ncbi:ATP synthase F1 subunit gamma [Dehalobacterium formicoaceticum]|uniref:ATP synthase gamma chain n=1 Tax=Dehalobacterium formicoaceticum TaxID=51515 RepID=A0ABT1Y683_9FIRM|nr:ATP synthase F1 subunit gamma [Dehalobacterium formicoaceticum]MCR6545424.1 ATP synthase F1 subunit gamma [Dehalobacterium formicoaceticum]
MANARDIRRRIRSVKNMQQITKAMKMVSASKLRKAQENVTAARPYALKIKEVLEDLAGSVQEYSHPLMEEREVKKIGLVVFTGDRGLCGGFNSNLIRMTEHFIADQGKEAALIAVGSKGRDYFKKRGVEITEEYISIGDNPTFIQGKELAKRLIALYSEAVFDEIYLMFTEFKTAMTMRPMTLKLLPIQPGEKGKGEMVEYLYEPSEASVMERLLPSYVETIVYRALLESKASEHGARMTAMSSATDNTEEIIAKLTLNLNRARQAAITTEISEIVSGAAALQ